MPSRRIVLTALPVFVAAVAAGLFVPSSTGAADRSVGPPTPASAAGPAGPAGPASAVGPPARFHSQRIGWHPCRSGPDDEVGRQLDAAGAQCGEIEVPLDYADPAGRTITVAFSRLPAADRARRIGVLLMNDGGPGSPALAMPVTKRAELAYAGRRFDLVGVDPRFTGRSTPIDCRWPTSLHLRAAATRADFSRTTTLHKDLATRCADRYRELLPHATTRNTARDLDVLRAPLGEPKVSYLGYSYGSYLGAVYLQLFGHRADRFVLEGPIDPAKFGPGLMRDTGVATRPRCATGQPGRRHVTTATTWVRRAVRWWRRCTGW